MSGFSGAMLRIRATAAGPGRKKWCSDVNRFTVYQVVSVAGA